MPILAIRHFILIIFGLIKKLLLVFYYQPLFCQYLEKAPKHLYLANKLPYIAGNPTISIGEYCTIMGIVSIVARTQLKPGHLTIGNRVFVGHLASFYVGNRIEVGDYCMIAQGCILRGYSGHPIDPEARKLGLPDDDSNVMDIVLENNVWLGQNVTVNSGVRIGENSIIASGSIVTKDIPANVIAGGVPAVVLRDISTSTSHETNELIL